MTTKIAKSVFEKVEPFIVAKARKKFIQDNLPYLYTRDCELAAKAVIKMLSDEKHFEYVRTETLLEDMIANTLEREYKYICRAEKLGYTNAMGYDVLDTTQYVYVEAKDYQVSQRGGDNAKLSAMISGLSNKFCSVVALVIDPYRIEDEHYKLYFIPPEAIPSDSTDCIDIPHHKLICHENVVVYEQLERPGGAFADYRIQSLNDLQHHSLRLKSINIKKLARVIRDLETANNTSASQQRELEHLLALFKNCISTGNRKIKSKKKFPYDHKDEMYTISETNTDRIFFDGNRIITTQAQE